MKRKLPEAIDFEVMSNDPADETDKCHEDDDKHHHVKPEEGEKS